MKYSPISLFLRNLLVRKHFWFSCCASCGEIKTPLGKRLCASLAVDFPVDAVIISAFSDEPALRKIREANPWLRNIIAVAEALAEVPAHLLPALIHTLPGLSACFVAARSAADLASPLHVLDFFTPNGLPLIALSRLEDPGHFGKEEPPPVNAVPAAPRLYAHTVENAEFFLPLFSELLEKTGKDRPGDAPAFYAAALAHWTFRAGKGILAR